MAETSKAVLTTVTPVSEAVQEQIHFDTLWATTQSALALYAGQSWSARGEDDPGVTLLQALAYGVSDISYRHTLPLQDLLTEKNGVEHAPDISLEHDGSLFAPEFGPDRALTSSPVTMEDYRRAILDLVPLAKGNNRFCFRDVQIALLPREQSYKYVNAPNKYAFHFASSASQAADESLYYVVGHYQLWVTLTPGTTREEAVLALCHFLKNHRNLCEWEITSPFFVPVTVQTPFLQLVLEDDLLLTGDDIAKAVAHAIFAMNQVLLPAPERKKAEVLLKQGESAENIYTGPRLTHGWITHLPPERPVFDGVLAAKADVPDHALSAAVVSKVPGIRAVNFRAANREAEFKPIATVANRQTQLWVSDNGALLSNLHEGIELYRHGQLVPATVWENGQVVEEYQRLNDVAYLAEVDPVRKVPCGRMRNPGFYRTVGASLPSIYGLQQAADRLIYDKDAGRLLQFLRPFEQCLANSADQLRKLPRLLAFDNRDPNASIWGGADWPSSQDDALACEQTQKVFDSTVLADIQQIVSAQSKDIEKELIILDHLLGYFGEQRASRVLNMATQDALEFLHVQQGALRQVTRLAYERAAISISKVSALQRKIAYRLGIGKRLFDEDLQREQANFPKEPLPFYVIEHQELLPVAPEPERLSKLWPAEQTVESFKQVGETLLLTLKGPISSLTSGMLIELKQAEAPVLPLSSLVLHEVKGNTVSIQLDQHTRLRSSMPMLLQKDALWKWQIAQVWLKRVVYDVSFQKTPESEQTENVILNVRPSFPIELVEKTRFALRPKARWMTWPTKADLVGNNAHKNPDVVVEVVKADPLRGTVTVKWICDIQEGILNPDGNPTVAPVKVDVPTPEKLPPNWSVIQNDKFPYAWSVPCKRESFAFTLSLVLDRSWLEGSQTPEELDRWIAQIAREEMPSHLNLQVHWLDRRDFTAFASKYLIWQNDGRPVGDQSYELLRLLGIGERPVDGRGGIGFALVASLSGSQEIEERFKKEPVAVEHDRLLQQEEVVYVRGSGMKF